MYSGAVSVHSVGSAPRLTVLGSPLNISIQPATNAGVTVARLRQDEGFDEAEAHDEHHPEAQQDEADQAEPAGLHRLPGVEARQAEHTEEGHGTGDHVNHFPPGRGH